MRWRVLVPSLLLLAALPAGDVPAAPPPVVLVVVAPLSGDLASAGAEVRDGAEAAGRYWSGNARLEGRPVQVVPIDGAGDPKDVEREVARARPAGLVLAAGGRETAALAALARRTRVPAVLASVWAPPFTVDPADPLFHLGGNAVDQAVFAGGYARIPMAARKAAALHDGSAPAIALAGAFLRNLHADVASGGLHEIPATEEETARLVATLAEQGVDVAFVSADRPAALRLARARRLRLLLADGLLDPEIGKAAEGGRFLAGTCPYLEDDVPARYRIGRIDRHLPPAPLGERGYGAASLLLEAIAEAKGRARQVLPALRARGDAAMLGAPLFSGWGQARHFRWFLDEEKPEGGLGRVKPAYLPDHAGGWLLRQKPAASFPVEPDTRVVLLTFGDGAIRTIERDLKSIGLHTGGYESKLDAMVLDEVLARALGRLGRLFWRNADGTPIPGASWRISFVAELPEGVRRQDCWIARIAGDDPSAGGRAADPVALVFSTFIVRTIYLNRALEPPLSRADQDYFTGEYGWGKSVEQNVRHDEVRCLLDSLAGAIAMTTAHEVGHLAGLGHDTASPRSIMNVKEGGGLEPDWAEWAAPSIPMLTSRLKREDAEGGRRR